MLLFAVAHLQIHVIWLVFFRADVAYRPLRQKRAVYVGRLYIDASCMHSILRLYGVNKPERKDVLDKQEKLRVVCVYTNELSCFFTC